VDGEESLVGRLRAGDAGAFGEVVRAWSPAMLRAARAHLATDAAAEDVVQETWLAVIRGLAGFEGRSTLRTWVFHILANRAKTHGRRESRQIPWSSLYTDEPGPTVDPGRFRGTDEPYPGHWRTGGQPRPWRPSPEDAAVAGEIRVLLAEALRELPPAQQTVVSLRDVHGMGPAEVCQLLGITAGNQRVLLHRGRARLRAALDGYYHGAGR
jgi:RNA polymerase sigma-70 factor, ECF subfamily